MAQRLIVEGKDAIVLSNILMKRKLSPPKGYRNSHKFKTEFIKKAGGIDKIKMALVEELQSPEVSHIGIIVDANNQGAKARFDFLKNIIKSTLKVDLPKEFILSKSGYTFQIMENLSVGIWIMPDNQNNGYLEHFVTSLIPTEDKTWNFVNEKVEELMTKPFCEFSEIKKQKAILHTYLALKESPGLPMGTAVLAGYLDAFASSADDFVTWFENSFELYKST